MKLLFILLLGLGFTQTKLETRVYELPTFNFNGFSEMDIDLFQITGYNLDYALIGMVNVSDFSTSNETETDITLQHITYPNGNEIIRNIWLTIYADDETASYTTSDYIYSGGELRLAQIDTGAIHVGYVNILLAVTAEFPEEDTGYIEEGYQFCVQPGANLLSFPCDNPISVNQSLPQGAENFITQIVGQGVATTYNPALGWVGSLDNFSPGSGYWFKSNESLCFEYDCVED